MSFRCFLTDGVLRTVCVYVVSVGNTSINKYYM